MHICVLSRKRKNMELRISKHGEIKYLGIPREKSNYKEKYFSMQIVAIVELRIDSLLYLYRFKIRSIPRVSTKGLQINSAFHAYDDTLNPCNPKKKDRFQV